MTEAVIRRWRKLQDEDIHNFFNLTLPGITSGEMDRLCRKHVKKDSAYKALVGKPEEKW